MSGNGPPIRYGVFEVYPCRLAALRFRATRNAPHVNTGMSEDGSGVGSVSLTVIDQVPLPSK